MTNEYFLTRLNRYSETHLYLYAHTHKQILFLLCGRYPVNIDSDIHYMFSFGRVKFKYLTITRTLRRTKNQNFYFVGFKYLFVKHDIVLCHDNTLCNTWTSPKCVNKLCHIVVVMFCEHDSRVYSHDWQTSCAKSINIRLNFGPYGFPRIHTRVLKDYVGIQYVCVKSIMIPCHAYVHNIICPSSVSRLQGYFQVQKLYNIRTCSHINVHQSTHYYTYIRVHARVSVV